MLHPQQTLRDVDLYVIVYGLAELHASTFAAFRSIIDETGIPFTLIGPHDSFDEGLIPIALAPFLDQDSLHSWLSQLPAASTGKYPFDELPIAVIKGSSDSYLIEGGFTEVRVRTLLRLVADMKKKQAIT